MRRAGQSLIEVTVGLVVMMPVLLVLVDLSSIFLAVQANDSTCQNAARAAAGGNPDEATSRALLVVNRANSRTSGPIVCSIKMQEPAALRIISRPLWQVDDETGAKMTSGGPVTGEATVTTEVFVRPFVVQLAFGGKSPMRFRSQHTFPVSYVQPAM